MRQRPESYEDRLERVVLQPLQTTGNAYRLLVFILGVLVAWGGYAFVVQYHNGLAATGMRDVVSWGLYLVNFVFFIGISHAGTLISAILRVSDAGWRTPITRMAEMITVVAISIGALCPIIDLGRPERVWHIITWGRFQSPLLWDIVSITSYLTGSLIYLYLPMVPDFAIMRDKLARGTSSLRHKIYTFMALGWHNTPEQRHRLEKGIGIMAVTIIPIAVSVHTVVSFVFSMLLRPGWDSTAFGIYFVIGAIFSGIASLIIVMVIFRKVFHFEEYLTEKHFRNLGKLLLVALLFYVYLTLCEYLTTGYKLRIEEKTLIGALMTGPDAIWFWFFVIAGLVIPALLIIWKRGPIINRLLIAAILVNISMWIKRFVIIIPTLQVPLMPYEFGSYTPTWVEWSITLASVAGFVLIFALFAKAVPLISMWEVAESHEEEEKRESDRLTERMAPRPSGIGEFFARVGRRTMGSGYREEGEQ